MYTTTQRMHKHGINQPQSDLKRQIIIFIISSFYLYAALGWASKEQISEEETWLYQVSLFLLMSPGHRWHCLFAMIPFGNVPPWKADCHDKKILKEHKGTKRGRRSSRPDREPGLAIQPGHSNSERMLMRLLWSLRCFPCFQHLQGPHGAAA